MGNYDWNLNYICVQNDQKSHSHYHQRQSSFWLKFFERLLKERQWLILQRRQWSSSTRITMNQAVTRGGFFPFLSKAHLVKIILTINWMSKVDKIINQYENTFLCLFYFKHKVDICDHKTNQGMGTKLWSPKLTFLESRASGEV